MSENSTNLPPIEWIKRLPQTAKEAIVQMSLTRKAKDEAEETLKQIDKEYDYLRMVHVPRMMENEGIENLRLTGIGLIYLQAVVRARVNSQNKAQAYQWLEDNGHGGLVTETVNAQSLSSAVKEMLSKNEEVPSDLFHVDALTQAAIRSK
jgi:hypothetical protein